MNDKERIKKLEQDYDRLVDKLNEVIKEHNRIICRLDQLKRGAMLHIQKFDKAGGTDEN